MHTDAERQKQCCEKHNGPCFGPGTGSRRHHKCRNNRPHISANHQHPLGPARDPFELNNACRNCKVAMWPNRRGSRPPPSHSWYECDHKCKAVQAWQKHRPFEHYLGGVSRSALHGSPPAQHAHFRYEPKSTEYVYNLGCTNPLQRARSVK